HDAEEAAQEALARAYRALPNFGGERRFYPWLRVIAANVCTDRARRRQDPPLAEPAGGDVVVESVFERLDQAFVRAALRDLNPRHQTALSLWADGHPSRRIAEELGCSTGAVDVTLHRARQSFRTRFLALSGEGTLGGLVLVPAALGRWAHRWRARIVTRAGEHADLASPLVAKLAAGAIAVTIVGGAVATSRSPQQVPRTASPPNLVHVLAASASAQSGAPSPAASVAGAPTGAVGQTPAASSSAATPARPSPPPDARPSLTPRLMSANQAQARSQGAPIKVEIPGGPGLAVDPSAVTTILRPNGGHS
ncbi:MAG: sigma-70 family RNA polymerase sigma factor, partial [Acidimicrobiia bacterium]|nr:sigma-70 family RNA polymerase sigma factor [Acidimicrobiia bacterium]